MAKTKLYAASVKHRHGFGCIGAVSTRAGAQALIDAWMETDGTDDDEFDISTITVELHESAPVPRSWERGEGDPVLPFDVWNERAKED